jgi:hypothetical protein
MHVMEICIGSRAESESRAIFTVQLSPPLKSLLPQLFSRIFYDGEIETFTV